MTILINKAHIAEYNTNRIVYDIIENGVPYSLWAEVDTEYSQYLTTELADAIVYLCVPLATRYGYDIISEIPVSEMLLHNLNEILLPHLAMGDDSLKNVRVKAPGSGMTFNGTAVGTGMSGGVDSLYTLIQYMDSPYKSLNLTHLLVTSSSFDLWDEKIPENTTLEAWLARNQTQINRAESIAREVDLPLIKMYSNFYNYICVRKDAYLFLHGSVHNYITMANVLILKKLWRGYYFSSGIPFTYFNLAENSRKDTVYHELISMHTLTIPGFFCFSGGAKSDRLHKTMELADTSIAQKHLHPCFTKEQSNCSHSYCNKCLRALLALDHCDKLDKMKEVFDIDRYKNNRITYLVELVKNKDDIFYKELYKAFLIKYPSLMKTATRIYEATRAPVARDFFNIIDGAYNMTVKFLALDDLTIKLKYYFQQNDIDHIYYMGDSRLGGAIINTATRLLKVSKYNFDDGINPDELIFEISTDSNLRSRNIKALKDACHHNFLTLEDLYNQISKI